MKFNSCIGILFIITFCLHTGCAFKRITKVWNLNYDPTGGADQKLNIFSPRKPKGLKDVFIFIHGGNWNSGKKSLYNFLGSRFARKDIVTVIIDYPLSPKVNYNEMATSSAMAVAWVKNNIEKYGGNPDKIYVSGHSAGGHLAALITVRNEYFDTLKIKNPIRGTILIDAAGLDMYGYLKKENLPKGHNYFKVFTSNPKIWKEATPMYHLHQGMPAMLIYQGEKTYPSIKESNEKFQTALKVFVPKPNYKVLKNKKHIPMITQFFNSRNRLYNEIIEFMKEGANK